MLFNSHEFIFIFLPVALVLYFALGRWVSDTTAKIWLVFASLAFYSYWEIGYLPVILFSLVFNYLTGNYLQKENNSSRIRYTLLVIGIVVNVALLGYYKYTDFVLSTLNQALNADFNLINIVLPLAISFFTFQQIAYLVDSFQGKVKEKSLLNYSLFVTFFPQLIAGPIVHHSEMMPQFKRTDKRGLNYENASKGIFIFFNGLFKKVIIADTLAVYASSGFDQVTELGFGDAWLTSLSYTFQLYYDFSGYTDMAIGIALLFNIHLPFNFNAPYKAVDIQDFWRRWHITLSRFLKDYIYIPLGGNRNGKFNTYRNLFLTFLIGGIWHGAGWTFIFWGVLHGIAMMIHRAWKKAGLNMHRILAWFITFQFVNIAWVFFRAKTWADAEKVLSGMFGRSLSTRGINDFVTYELILGLIVAGGLIALLRNTNTLQSRFKPNTIYLAGGLSMGVIAILSLFKISEFIYFGF